MKAYLAVTGTVFFLIVLAHLLRYWAEGPRLASDVVFHLLTLLSAGLSGWAFLLLRRAPRP